MIKRVILSPILVVIALSFFLFWIQSGVIFFSGILGVKLNLIPVVALYIALYRSWSELFAFVVVSCLLYDSVSLNPLGATLLSLIIPTYVVYSYRSVLLLDSLWVQMFFGFLVTVFSEGATLLILTGLPVTPTIDGTLVWTFVVLGVTGSVLAPIVFGILSLLNEKIDKMRPHFVFGTDYDKIITD